MNWVEYYFGHCLRTGWREILNNFKMWRDLIRENYEAYVLLEDDDPFEECYSWFWSSINMDETIPKEFLEYLIQISDDVKNGKEKIFLLDENFFDRIRDLTENIELNDEDFT